MLILLSRCLSYDVEVETSPLCVMGHHLGAVRRGIWLSSFRPEQACIQKAEFLSKAKPSNSPSFDKVTDVDCGERAHL